MTWGNRLLKLHPAVWVVGSFLMLITVGTILLMLPVSSVSSRISWIDALFTATSAVCVTGLTVVDTGKWFTVFGQIVILALIQVGGLGVMTISVTLFHWLGRSVSFRHRMAMQEAFSHTPRKDLYSLLQAIMMFTVVSELLGAVFLTWIWSRWYPLDQAVYLAVFHSVSAFCNAGFSLFSDSLVGYRNVVSVNLVVCILIVMGGIGFPVVYDMARYIRSRSGGPHRHKLSVQTKTVLTTTAILVIGGAILFWWLEQSYTLENNRAENQVLQALFQSVTSRTAGFNTLDLSRLGHAGTMLLIVLMFIGGSPGSCAGGIKTTTVAVLWVSARCRLQGTYPPHLFKKTMNDANILKSLAIAGLSVFCVGIVFFLMLISGQDARIQQLSDLDPFRVLMFEVVSAFGTVGLSMGATSVIDHWGKMLLITIMLIGRVGVVSIAYALMMNGTKTGIEYAEENIMVG